MLEPDEEFLADALGKVDELLDEVLPEGKGGGLNALANLIGLIDVLLPAPESANAITPVTPVEDPGPPRFGRFELQGILGSGGNGVVYRARDPQLNLSVALKVPRVEYFLGPEEQAQFLNEARLAASLDDPGIVRVFEAGMVGPVAYITSACCDGPNLSEWLKGQSAPVEVRLAARIVAWLARAVQHAHDHKILHRDIKPSNILLFPDSRNRGFDQEPSPGFIPKLGDFGLARLMDERTGQWTRTGFPIGTFPYISPEQARGRRKEIGTTTDVYSLGAVLYELLTHRPPFPADNSPESLRLVLDEDPVPPRALRPRIPRDLETICLACLRKERSKRYSTAVELKDDLERFLNNRPIKMRPTPLHERLIKATRRHPFASSALAGFLILILGGLGAVSWSNTQLREYNVELERQRDHSNRLNYGSQLQLARRAADAGQLGRAQQILHSVEPAPGSTDLREFAWQYLWAELTREAILLRESESDVTVTQVSPDGGFLFWSDMSSLGMVGVEDGRELWMRRLPTTQNINDATFHPSGRFFACSQVEKDGKGAEHGSTVMFRTTDAGKVLARLAVPAPWLARQVHLLDDGRKLAVFRSRPEDARKAAVTLYSIASDEGGFRIIEEFTRYLDGWFLFASDGTSFVHGDDSHVYIVYDTSSLSERCVLSYNGDALYQFAMTIEGQKLAAGLFPEQAIGVWDIASGRQLNVAPSIDPMEPFWLAIQPEGRKVIEISLDGKTANLIDLGTGDILPIIESSPPDRNDTTESPRFSQNGLIFFLARKPHNGPTSVQAYLSQDGTLIRTFPVRDFAAARILNTFELKGSGPAALVRMGRSVWSWKYEKFLRPPRVAAMAHTDEAWAADFSPDGTLLVTGSDDTDDPLTIRVWDSQTGQLLRGWKAHRATVTDVAVSPDGKTLASSSLDPKDPLCLWDLDTGELQAKLQWTREGARALEFSPDGRRLAAVGNTGVLQVWDVATRKPTLRLRAGSGKVHDVCYSPDGSRLATVGDDQHLRLWDASSGQLVAEHRDPEQLFAVAFSPTESRIAIAGRRGIVTLLDSRTLGSEISLHSDDSEIRALRFSPDGRTLAAAGISRSIRLWDPSTRQELLSLDQPTHQVNELCFSPSGDMLVSCDHSGKILRYSAKSAGAQ